MPKRTFFEVRKIILKTLNDKKEYSFAELERKVNTNWETVRLHCKDLNLFGAIIISKENKIKITDFGSSILRKLEKSYNK